MIGLGLLALAVWQSGEVLRVVDGSTRELTDDVLEVPGGGVLVGAAGIGVVGVAGGLVLFAALTSEVSTATGLDRALDAIGAAPAGRWLLSAVAVGFAAFGVYALAGPATPTATRPCDPGDDDGGRPPRGVTGRRLPGYRVRGRPPRSRGR